MGQRAALKITVDTRDDVVGGDHVHAPGKGAHDIGAEPEEILLIAIPNWQDAGAPTTSIAATFQHVHGVDELMRGIRFPVWRFSPSSDHDARMWSWVHYSNSGGQLPARPTPILL